MNTEYRAEIAREFSNKIPKKNILVQSEQVTPYECDGLPYYRQKPLLVVLPQTNEQVLWILKVCNSRKIPVVTRGAGTGLSGGALPIENAVLLVMTKLNRILEIDLNNRYARVQPGVRNLAISEAVQGYGLYYAPDPSSQIACSIGGNVAENAGGVHCLKYGLTLHNVREITLITIEGETLKIGSTGYDSPGYDLLALLTGSEGMLGIIVEVVVNLLPIPDATKALLASFSSVEVAGNAVAAIISDGIIPAGLEMMDKLAIQAAEDFVHAGYPVNAEAILICELDGVEIEVLEELQRVQAVLQRCGATQIRVATTDEQRMQFWAGRKAAFPAVGRISPDYYCMDGTIPRAHLASVLRAITTLGVKYGLRVANVFHAGDGNLHPLILFDASIPGELSKAEEMGAKILETCVAHGGTVTGEHGVGIEKLTPMCSQFNNQELKQFYAVKEAFDPESLLNPGKAIPTLQRCAEFGAMHVHNGKLPHDELPRF